MEKKKIILAFSGGLDTSFCIPYLREQGFSVISVTVDTGGFTRKKFQEIEKTARMLGSEKHLIVDGKTSFMREIISYILKTDSLYQDVYPHLCADRYTIAQEIVKIAHTEKTTSVAHGSTAMGNDQVRFDLAFMSLDPTLTVLTPIRDIKGNRTYEKKYLKEQGFILTDSHAKYSINQNMLGITYSGSEIDSGLLPDESLFQLTKPTQTTSRLITLSFKHGLPVAINGKKQSSVTILKTLNACAGSFGIGRDHYTGDCIIGIKGHICFEAPGIHTLLKAHKALSQLVLTKRQQELGKYLSQQFSELIYSGNFFDPVIAHIKACIDSQQQSVTGDVTLTFAPFQLQVVTVTSPYSLIQNHIATYAQHARWSTEDAIGFIKLYGMQNFIAATVHKEQSERGEGV